MGEPPANSSVAGMIPALSGLLTLKTRMMYKIRYGLVTIVQFAPKRTPRSYLEGIRKFDGELIVHSPFAMCRRCADPTQENAGMEPSPNLELFALEAPQRNDDEEYCPYNCCRDRDRPHRRYRLSCHQSACEFCEGPGEDQHNPFG